MTAETIRLLAGVLFLLIAVVGGGFTVKELSIPQVPHWGRVLSGLLGALFTIPLVLSLAGPGDEVENTAQEGPEAPAAEGERETPAAAGEVVLYEDDHADTTPESISLVQVTATSAHAPPLLGDRVTVAFTIENVGEAAFALAYTFIGARDPDEDHRDFGESNQGDVLEPGERVSVRSSILADEAGIWRLWPCYTFAADGEDAYCPDEWGAFELLVEQ